MVEYIHFSKDGTIRSKKWKDALARKPQFLDKSLEKVEKPMAKELQQDDIVGYIMFNYSQGILQIVIDDIRIGVITVRDMNNMILRKTSIAPIKLP